MSSLSRIVSDMFNKWKPNFNENSTFNTSISNFLNNEEDDLSYRDFVTEHYRNKGYTVWTPSQKERIEENPIDLVIKKDQEVILIKCKTDQVDIDEEALLDFKAQAFDLITEHQIFENYRIKLRYSLASFVMNELAFEYIQDNQQLIDYKVLKPIRPIKMVS